MASVNSDREPHKVARGASASNEKSGDIIPDLSSDDRPRSLLSSRRQITRTSTAADVKTLNFLPTNSHFRSPANRFRRSRVGVSGDGSEDSSASCNAPNASGADILVPPVVFDNSTQSSSQTESVEEADSCCAPADTSVLSANDLQISRLRERQVASSTLSFNSQVFKKPTSFLSRAGFGRSSHSEPNVSQELPKLGLISHVQKRLSGDRGQTQKSTAKRGRPSSIVGPLSRRDSELHLSVAHPNPEKYQDDYCKAFQNTNCRTTENSGVGEDLFRSVQSGEPKQIEPPSRADFNINSFLYEGSGRKELPAPQKDIGLNDSAKAAAWKISDSLSSLHPQLRPNLLLTRYKAAQSEARQASDQDVSLLCRILALRHMNNSQSSEKAENARINDRMAAVSASASETSGCCQLSKVETTDLLAVIAKIRGALQSGSTHSCFPFSSQSSKPGSYGTALTSRPSMPCHLNPVKFGVSLSSASWLLSFLKEENEHFASSHPTLFQNNREPRIPVAIYECQQMCRDSLLESLGPYDSSRKVPMSSATTKRRRVSSLPQTPIAPCILHGRVIYSTCSTKGSMLREETKTQSPLEPGLLLVPGERWRDLRPLIARQLEYITGGAEAVPQNEGHTPLHPHNVDGSCAAKRFHIEHATPLIYLLLARPFTHTNSSFRLSPFGPVVTASEIFLLVSG